MENARFQPAPAALWFQAVAIAQFSRCLQVFSRSHQLSDLPDMSQIVHGPLMQHLLQGDFAGLLVPRAAFTGASRQGTQILHVGLALLFKMVEWKPVYTCVNAGVGRAGSDGAAQ